MEEALDRKTNSPCQGSKLTFWSTSKVLLVRFFFHEQTGETTSKLFPFEMSMTISDKKIRIDISHRLLMS